MSWIDALRACALALLVVACAQQEGPGGAAAREAQQPLHREEVVIETANGPVRFQAEIADTAEEQNRGLMFRRHMERDHGMLFVFSPPRPVGFWMHNTHIALDIIFIGADGRILNIAESTTPYSDAEIPSRGVARGVLEINAGLSRELGLAPGDRVRHRIFPN